MKVNFVKVINRKILVLACVSILSACVTPDSPSGPRVSGSQSGNKRAAQPASLTQGTGYEQSLSQGMPFEQTKKGELPNSESINFPEGSGPPVQAEANIPEGQNNNIPPSTMSTNVSTTSVAPATGASSLAKVSINANTAPAEALVDGKSGNAVRTLLADAKKATDENRLDRAASSLERAVRIEPNNPNIWYNLAQIKLHQGDYVGSENYFKKAIGLAGDSSTLAKNSYKMIAAGRKAQGDANGAKDAERKSQ